jgi:dihydroneopterin aldolase
LCTERAGAGEFVELEHRIDGEQIFTLIAQRWGGGPVQLELRKCAAPVPGFSGTVAVRRFRSAA